MKGGTTFKIYSNSGHYAIMEGFCPPLFYLTFLKGLKTMSNTHKVKVLEEAFYKGGIRPVNSVIDYEGDTIPSWATLADGQASTVQGSFKIENPTPPKNTLKAPKIGNKNNKNSQTIVTIGSLPDDKKAELIARANEAGVTEDINTLTLEAFEAKMSKRAEEKQIARLEELKTIAIEKYTL